MKEANSDRSTTSSSSRGGGNSSLTSFSSSQHQLWVKVRSIWRLKIVGLLVLVGSVFWLQTYHFQFGKAYNTKGSSNNRVPIVGGDSVTADDGKNNKKNDDFYSGTLFSNTGVDDDVSEPRFDDLVSAGDDDDNAYDGTDEVLPNTIDIGLDDDDDDDYDDAVTGSGTRGYQQQQQQKDGATTAPTPCPFLSPKITGHKNWTLYSPQAYKGLSLLRPDKESILMTAYPGCVPMVLPKQVRKNNRRTRVLIVPIPCLFSTMTNHYGCPC